MVNNHLIFNYNFLYYIHYHKKKSKKDYVSLTLGLCAIVYETFCLIHYN